MIQTDPTDGETASPLAKFYDGEIRAQQEALRSDEIRLRAIADAQHVLVAYIDSDRRYRFVNLEYERWFGQGRANTVGRRVDEVLGPPAYEVVRPHIDDCLAGHRVTFQAYVPYRNGNTRMVEGTYVPHRDSTGAILGFVSLVADITERRRLEEARDIHVHRTERLLRVTAAIADAVSPAQVFEAVVDRVGDAVGASSAALFLVDADVMAATLARSTGYSDAARASLERVAIDHDPSSPVLESIRVARPVWIDSQADLLAAYPHLAAIVTPGRAYRIACLPLIAQSRTLGALALTFDDVPSLDDSDRSFLLLVARYSSQALERLELLAAERRSKAAAEAVAARMELLGQLSRAFSEAATDVDAVLDRLVTHVTASHADMCAVLLMPEQGDVLQVAAARHRNPDLTAEVLRLAASRPTHIGEGFAGGVAATGVSAMLPAASPELVLERTHPSFRDWLTRNLPHSVMAVPLKVRGHILGVLSASRQDASPPFRAEDLTLLEEVADRAALALENARLISDDQRARDRAELLYGLARVVIGAQRIEDVYEAALDALLRALGTPRASILTYDDHDVMRFRAWRGLSGEYRDAVEGHSPWARDVRDAQPIVVPDVTADPALAGYADLFRAEAIGALAFIPLLDGTRLVGKFMVYYDAPHAFASSELELARAIANHLAAAAARFAAVEELQATVHFNEMFTGILGHDLRNPLNAISTAAELALLRSESLELTRPLSRIVTSSARMARMIEQLLDFTRVRLGAGIPLSPALIDLVPLSRQILDELEDAHPQWTLQMEHSGDTQGTWDADRLAQVLSNLVANAVQHGASTDPVTLRIHGAVPEVVRIEIHNAGTIPRAVLPRIFEPLSRGTRTLGRSHGLGLGLYITREIVRAHGGTIEVRSSEQAGTTFTVTLPRSSPA